MPNDPSPVPPPARPASAPGDTLAGPEPTRDPRDPVPAVLDLRPGARPVPDYELVAKLGEGGFGQVWRARDAEGYEAALKFLRLDERTGPSELRSLDVMKNIRHPHLVTVFRHWRLGGYLVIAMELAERTLYHRLAEAERQGLPGIPRDELIDYMREAAKGLDHLHALGIQHRDVKPQNFLLVGGSVKVADFGLAKLVETGRASTSGALTPAYAAPEFFQGQTNANSDQYSLAVSYCQLRGGQLPFTGTPTQVLYAHLQAEPDLSMLAQAEKAVVARALAKKPADRWPSCKTFVEALAQAPDDTILVSEGGRPVTLGAAPVTRLPATAEARSTVDAPTAARQAAVGRPSRAGAAVALGLLAVLALLGTAAFYRWPADALPVPAPETEVAGLIGPAPPAADPGRTGKGDEQPPAPAAEPMPPAPPPPPTELTNSLGMTLVRLPAGKFLRGSPDDEPGSKDDEGPRREVEITRPFYLGKHEVTRGQFRAFIEATGYQTDAERDGTGGYGYEEKARRFEGPKRKYTWKNVGFPQTDDHPVVNVSWNDAAAFCEWLSTREGRRYSLPTEAQWEYACRAGAATAYQGGADPESLARTGNVADAAAREAFPAIEAIAARDGYVFTAPAGKFQPNRWGLYDLHGNVWEWCADWYDVDAYSRGPTTDPTGPETGDKRVLRGGSWSNPPAHCRCAHRGKSPPILRHPTIGFRVALQPE